MDIHYWLVSQSVSVQQGGSLKSQPMAPRFQQLVEHSPLRVRNGHGEMGRQSWVKFKAKALMFPPSPTSGAMHYLPPGYNHTQQDVRFGYIVLPASDAVFLFMSMAACI